MSCKVHPHAPALLDAFNFLAVSYQLLREKPLLSLFYSLNNMGVHITSTHSSSSGCGSPIYMHLLLPAGVPAFHVSLLLPPSDNPRTSKKAPMVIYTCLKKHKKVKMQFVKSSKKC